MPARRDHSRTRSVPRVVLNEESVVLSVEKGDAGTVVAAGPGTPWGTPLVEAAFGVEKGGTPFGRGGVCGAACAPAERKSADWCGNAGRAAGPMETATKGGSGASAEWAGRWWRSRGRRRRSAVRAV
jgi:hypothetical protein